MKRLSKFNLAFLALMVISTVSLFAQGKVEFNTTDIYNKKVTDSVFRNSEITMINVWGTFCGPCIMEMPDLAKLNKDNASKKFQVVGIVIDAVNRRGKPDSENINTAKYIAEITGADYIHLVPDSKLLDGILEDVFAVPTTIFVDKNGKQIGETYTGSRSYSEWQKIINGLLK